MSGGVTTVLIFTSFFSGAALELAGLHHGISKDSTVAVANRSRSLTSDGAPTSAGESLGIVEHKKQPGGGYLPGSPLRDHHRTLRDQERVGAAGHAWKLAMAAILVLVVLVVGALFAVGIYSCCLGDGCKPRNDHCGGIATVPPLRVSRRELGVVEEEVEEVEEVVGQQCDCGCIGCLACILFMAVLIGITVWFGGPVEVIRWILVKVVPRQPRWWHALVFGGLIVFGMCFLPFVAVSFMMLNGLTFSFWIGMATNFAALAVAVSSTFVIGRFLAQERVRRWLVQQRYQQMEQVIKVVEDDRESLKLLVLFRFLPMPLPIKMYGPTLLRTPFWKILLTSLPHNLWMSALFASIGAAFEGTSDLLREGKGFEWGTVRWQQVVVFVLALLSTVGICVYAWFIYKRRLQEER